MYKLFQILIIVFQILSLQSQNFFLTSNYYYDIYCVTNTSSALAWVTKSTVETSKFASFEENNAYINNKNNNFEQKRYLKLSQFHWESKNSIEQNVGEIITDRRWEQFKLYDAKEDQFILTTNKLTKNFDVPLSIKADKEAHIFLCDGELIGRSNCYWLLLQGWDSNTTSLRKCTDEKIPTKKRKYPMYSCKKNRIELNHLLDSPRYLTNQYYKHYIVRKKDHKISFIENGQNVIFEYTDNEAFFNPTHLTIQSKRIDSLWKIHNYDYLFTSKKSEGIEVVTIDVVNGTVCVSMFLKLCEYCQLTLSLQNEHQTNSYKTETFYYKTSKWQEVRIWVEDVVVTKVVLILSTKSQANEGLFWAINDLKLCEKNGIRLISTKNQDDKCQLISEDNSIKILEETSEKEVSCPTDTVGPFCVPCAYLYKNCDYVKVCQKDSCSCSAGYYGNFCQKYCSRGQYGHGCLNKCSPNCNYGQCNFKNGHCDYNCLNNFIGPKCDQPNLIFISPPTVIAKSETSCTIQQENLNLNQEKTTQLLYQIQYSKFSTIKWITYKPHIFISSTQFIQVENLESDTIYLIRAVVIDDETKTVFDLSNEIKYITCKTLCSDVNIDKIIIKTTNTSVILSEDVEKNKSSTLCKDVQFQIRDSNNYVIMSNILFNIKYEKLKPFTTYILIELKSNSRTQFQTTEGVPDKVKHLKQTKITTSSISLEWEKPDSFNGNFLYYLIEYKLIKHKACDFEDFEIYNLTTNFEKYVLRDNIFAYTKYLIKIYAVNYKFKGMAEEIFVETDSIERITNDEIPTIQNISFTSHSTMLSFPENFCKIVRGSIFLHITATCLDSWCNKIPIDLTTTFKTEIFLPKLYPYSKYNISMVICRYGNENCISKSEIITSPPTIPNEISQLTVYSRSENYFKIKWKLPYPPTGVLKEFKIKYTSRTESVTKTILISSTTCKIWQDWHCAEINLLKSQSITYKIQVSARNENPSEFGPIKSLERVQSSLGYSEKPANLTIVWTNDNDIILTWEHPFITNGDINFFSIEFKKEVDRNSKTYRFYIDENQYNLTYTQIIDSKEISPSTKYKIGVSANNGLEGRKNFVTDTSRPIIPNLSKLQVVGIDTNIKITANIANNKNMTILFLIKNDLFTKNIDLLQLENDLDIHLDQYTVIAKCTNLATELKLTLNSNKTISPSCNAIDPITIIPKNYYNISTLAFNSFLGKSSYVWYWNETIITSSSSDGTNYLYILFLLFLLLIPVICFVKRRSILKKITELEVRATSNINETNIPLTSQVDNKTNIKPKIPIKPKLASRTTKYSKRVNVFDLENYVKEALQSDELQRQHKLFPRGPTQPWDYGSLPANKSKNRYNNLVAYDHTRVVLTKINNDSYSDYINANHIDGYKLPQAYIATQGPKESTLNDFWRMIWQENVQHIVMVANLVENGKKKVAKYWPDFNESITFGEINVNFYDSKVFANYEERWFDVSCGQICRKINQIHFNSWPDHGVPLYAQSLVPFLQKMLTFQLSSKSPVLVHCSAGVGRTGTLILCDMTLRMAAREGAVDLLSNLEIIRSQRPNMVDNVEQYKLAHMIVIECLVGMKTSLDCTNLENKVVQLLEGDGIRLQMQYLKDTAWQDQAMKTMSISSGFNDIVESKNRFADIIPEIQGRIYLPFYPSHDPTSNYINAVRVDGFCVPGHFIVTQHPMPTTVGDFWRLIEQEKVAVVISLTRINTDDNTCCQFWPSKTNPVMVPVDYIKLELISEQTTQFSKQFKINLISSQLNWTVDVIEMKNSSPGKELPFGVKDFLGFWEESTAISRSSPIVLTCYDGVLACGIYAATSFLLERIKVEQTCDVCQAVRTIRQNRSQFIATAEQFQFLYKVAVEFVTNFQPYANFN